jgi:uncharacterized membrane protein
MMKITLLLGIMAVLVISGCTSSSDSSGAGGLVSTSPSQSSPASAAGEGNGGDVVKISVSEISGNAKFYTYNSNGILLKYFIVKGLDGKIRTAFDACDICGGYKGYRQEGNDMICNNCGRYFSINDIGTKNKGGGCWPSYLSHEISGDQIVIKKSELDAGSWRFK